ncbi:MAG: hypothetical protein ACUVTQ_09135 [Desulfotomaculales bacterium]
MFVLARAHGYFTPADFLAHRYNSRALQLIVGGAHFLLLTSVCNSSPLARP